MNLEQKINYLASYGIHLTSEQLEQNSLKKVVVGMSGGVDSSVVATLVKLMGFQTIGIFMKNWEEVDDSGQCSSEKDYADVEKVATQLEIPYFSLNFVEEYRQNVFQNFLDEYQKGNTPNPDILCNREIKFKVFYEKAMELGADFLATGHYCQHLKLHGQEALVKGADAGKDQTYFLYTMKSSVLEKVIFPIGHLQKSDVRKIASQFNLSTAKKKDSTGICFIGERDFKEFLGQYLKEQKGDFVQLETNKVLGRHDGSCFYTIGQRKGLGLGGPGGPWFVAGKNIETNEVYVVEGEDHPALYADSLVATEESWVNSEPNFPKKLKAKIRYRQHDQSCTVTKVNNKLEVVFDVPQRAISIGQSVVFYDEDVCLGGAIIESIGPNFYQQNLTLP